MDRSYTKQTNNGIGLIVLVSSGRIARILLIQVDDVVVAVSDGVSDNLWENEVCQTVCDSVKKWQEGTEGTEDGMVYVAKELMNAARVIAQDPFAESPFMERAVEEGLPMEGGKMDDISVVMGICRKRKG
jgi:protein phosphatase PTC7